MRRGLVTDGAAPSFLSSGLRCPIRVAKEPFQLSRCLKVFAEHLSFSETRCRCRGKWQEAKAQGDNAGFVIRMETSLHCLYTGRKRGRWGGEGWEAEEEGRGEGDLQPAPTCLS